MHSPIKSLGSLLLAVVVFGTLSPVNAQSSGVVPTTDFRETATSCFSPTLIANLLAGGYKFNPKYIITASGKLNGATYFVAFSCDLCSIGAQCTQVCPSAGSFTPGKTLNLLGITMKNVQKECTLVTDAHGGSQIGVYDCSQTRGSEVAARLAISIDVYQKFAALRR